MAHTGIFATSDEILTKAGDDYDTDVTEARINALCLQAESIINCASRRNWSDDYAGLNADVKGILSAAASSWVAIHIISYNFRGLSGNLPRPEAENRINVLRDDFLRNLSILQDMKVEAFIDGET